MKKISLVIIVLFIFSCKEYKNVETEYNTNLKYMIKENACNAQFFILQEYFNEYFELPNNPEETYKFCELDSNDSNFNIYVKLHFRDWFSKDSLNIKYVPIYNRQNNKKEYILILSSGIDGYFDNEIKKDDTIYLDEINKKMKLYDKFSYEKRTSMIIPDSTEAHFSYWNYFFGKKDFYTIVIPIILEYKASSIYITNFGNINKYYNILENRIPRFYCFKAKFKGQNDTSILLTNSNYVLNCKLYEKYDINKKDSLNIYGVLDSYDTIQNTFKFKNCIIVDTFETCRNLNGKFMFLNK